MNRYINALFSIKGINKILLEYRSHLIGQALVNCVIKTLTENEDSIMLAHKILQIEKSIYLLWDEYTKEKIEEIEILDFPYFKDDYFKGRAEAENDYSSYSRKEYTVIYYFLQETTQYIREYIIPEIKNHFKIGISIGKMTPEQTYSLYEYLKSYNLISFKNIREFTLIMNDIKSWNLLRIEGNKNHFYRVLYILKDVIFENGYNDLLRFALIHDPQKKSDYTNISKIAKDKECVGPNYKRIYRELDEKGIIR